MSQRRLRQKFLDMRLRWKRLPSPTGLARIGAAPAGFMYHDGNKCYAFVYPLGGGWQSPLKGWYWVVSVDTGIPAVNTCKDPVSTSDEAKKHAQDYVLNRLDKSSGNQ